MRERGERAEDRKTLRQKKQGLDGCMDGRNDGLTELDRQGTEG